MNQPGRATVFAIAPTGPLCATAGGTGTRYSEAARKTGGDVLSICASDYSPLLQSVAGRAFSPQDRFPLSATPDPTTIEVIVDGVPTPSGWTYDASQNQVVFTTKPPSGAKISIKYRKICP